MVLAGVGASQRGVGQAGDIAVTTPVTSSCLLQAQGSQPPRSRGERAASPAPRSVALRVGVVLTEGFKDINADTAGDKLLSTLQTTKKC